MDNYEMAMMWIADGMIWLAYEYEYWLRREVDIKKAIEWYRKAWDSESIKRANNLDDNYKW